VWFEPGLVLEILSAELTLSPTYAAGWGRSKGRPAWRCGSRGSPGDGATTRGPPQDATTTQELIDLYHTARRAPLSVKLL
jgi:hypothetical protein